MRTLREHLPPPVLHHREIRDVFEGVGRGQRGQGRVHRVGHRLDVFGWGVCICVRQCGLVVFLFEKGFV